MKVTSSAAAASPTTGMANRAPVGIISTLIEAARRQEALIDDLSAAVESGNEIAILQAAKNIAANRRKEIPAPVKRPTRNPRSKPTLKR